MNFFLHQHNIVKNLSPFYESSLVFRDDDRHNFLNTIGYYFCNKLIICITQRNGPESTEIGGTFVFWNQGKEGRVGTTSNLGASLRFTDDSQKVFLIVGRQVR